MYSRDRIESIKKKIISILDKYFGKDYFLFLFGSFAKGNPDRASDIDLAIYSKEPIRHSLILEAKQELEIKGGTLRNIELINLNEDVDKKLLENILKEAIIWKKPKNSEELLKNLKRRLKNFPK